MWMGPRPVGTLKSTESGTEASWGLCTCWSVWWRLRPQRAAGWSAARWWATAARRSRRTCLQEQSSSSAPSGTTSSDDPTPEWSPRCRSYTRAPRENTPPTRPRVRRSAAITDSFYNKINPCSQNISPLRVLLNSSTRVLSYNLFTKLRRQTSTDE